MKSIEQLAKEAYCAWPRVPNTSPDYAKLTVDQQARWIAVAQKLRAEIQAIH